MEISSAWTPGSWGTSAGATSDTPFLIDKTTVSQRRTPSSPIRLTPEEKATLDVYSPPPSTTSVLDFASRMPRHPEPDGEYIFTPSTIEEAFSDIIQWVSVLKRFSELPRCFAKTREQIMNATFPHVDQWEAEGKPLAPWNEANAHKMLDLLNQPKSKTVFRSFAYRHGMTQDEIQFRELVLSILTSSPSFWNGYGRRFEKSAQAVKYQLTGDSDWADMGRCPGSAELASLLRPERDWLFYKGRWLTAAKPESPNGRLTRVLKWYSHTYRDSNDSVEHFKWRWLELGPGERESFGEEALQLWTRPLRLDESQASTYTIPRVEQGHVEQTTPQ